MALPDMRRRHVEVYVSMLSGEHVLARPFRLLPQETVSDLKWLIKSLKKGLGDPSQMQLVLDTRHLPDNWEFKNAKTPAVHLTLMIKVRSCAVCGCQEQGHLMFCAGCKAAAYCSVACQTAHWQEHKLECQRISRTVSTFAEVACPNGKKLKIRSSTATTVGELKRSLSNIMMIDRSLSNRLLIVTHEWEVLHNQMRLAELDAFRAEPSIPLLACFCSGTSATSPLLDEQFISLATHGRQKVAEFSVLSPAMERPHIWTRHWGSKRARSTPR
eukprot:gnl/TRDRNA2_/TRDRNA2_89032_c0_seq1.p1 gnl/TRDRNA2_/TRDRNA2_89032_c0~~gnl/TRDRNA2_/TRDRNA2_89032_c0_seq1.p1  ORF type:complete len:292 (+),score=20.44 gnl/TRDRNA2_/TRDRNA2_89032_c0_seq1:63-878(+)